MKWLLTAGIGSTDPNTPARIEKALAELGITVYFTDFAETRAEHLDEIDPRR